MFDKNSFFDAPPIDYNKNNEESNTSLKSNIKSDRSYYSPLKKFKVSKLEKEEFEEPYKGWKHMADIIFSK